MTEILQNPAKFLDQLANVGFDAARKAFIAKLKPIVIRALQKSHMKSFQLTWKDVLPALDLISTLDDVKAAIQDPDKFLNDLMVVAGAVGRKAFYNKLKPIVERFLDSDKMKPFGLKWKDVLPAFELIDSFDEIKDAIVDPDKREKLFSNLLEVGGAAARLSTLYSSTNES